MQSHVRARLGGLTRWEPPGAGNLYSGVRGEAFFTRRPARPELEAISWSCLSLLAPCGGGRGTTSLSDLHVSSGEPHAHPEGICALPGAFAWTEVDRLPGYTAGKAPLLLSLTGH